MGCSSNKLWPTLALLSLLVASGCQKPKHSTPSGNTLPIVKVPPLEVLAALELTIGAQQVNLQRKADQWQLTMPMSAPVHPNRLENLWYRLTNLTGAQTVSSKKAGQIKKTYFQSPPVFQLSWQDQKGHQDSLWGAEGGQDKTVYVLQRSNGRLLQFAQAPWINVADNLQQLPWKKLLDLDFTAVTGLEFRYEDRLIVLNRNRDEAGSWSISLPQMQAVNPQGLLRLMGFLQGSEYVEVKEETVWGKTILSQYGLQKPIAQLTVRLEQRRLPKVLEFGQTEDNKDVLFAKYQDESRIVSVPAVFLNQCLIQLEQVGLDRTLIDFMPLVNKIEGDFPEEQRIAERHEKAWVMVNAGSKVPGNSRADAEVLVAFLNQLTFDNLVGKGSPDDQVFHGAQTFGKIIFYSNYRDPLVQLTFYRSDLYPEYVFIKNEANGRVVLMALDKLKPYLIHY